MRYIEYSTSAGHGTLVGHGVFEAENTFEVIDDQDQDGELYSRMIITPERYSEFISINGGERAV